MWNNRIIHHQKDKHDWYLIHEVYYKDDDSIESWTECGVEPFGDTIDELRHSYDLMAEAFDLPVLEEDELKRTHGVSK